MLRAAVLRRGLATRILPLPQTEEERNKTIRAKIAPIDSVLSKKNFFDSRHERLEDFEASADEIAREFWEARDASLKCKAEDPHLFFLAMGNVEMFRFMREMQAQGKLQGMLDEATEKYHEKWLREDLVYSQQLKRVNRETKALALAAVRAERAQIAEDLAKQHKEQINRVSSVVAAKEEVKEDTPEEAASKKAQMRKDLLKRLKAELASS